MAGYLLEKPDATEQEDAQEGAPQVPSILSITNNYVIGGADVSFPAEDGSRLLKLISANGVTVIDASLSAELAAYLAESLVAVEVIEQEDEDAGSTE